MDEFPAQGATCREVSLSLWGLPFRQSAASMLVMVPPAFGDRSARAPLLRNFPRGATSVPETVPRECHDRINRSGLTYQSFEMLRGERTS